jgi:predicted Zn finger-like uncharacterized protein
MIVKCSHCIGMMRVDESRLKPGRRLKVRCPHCRGIGIVAPTTARSLDESNEADQLAENEGSPGTAAFEAPDATEADQESKWVMFPAEEDGESPRKKTPPKKRRLRLIIFGLASLAVIGFFALLVNVILPGPPPKGSGVMDPTFIPSGPDRTDPARSR